LTGDDQTKLKHIMRAQASALAESLERDDYQAAENNWQSLTQLKIIGSTEVEQMIRELAGMPLKTFALRRVAAYREAALQHRFDEAERQLALLKTLLSHFPNERLGCSVESLEEVLRASREKKRIEEERIRNKIAQAEREATRKAREEADRELRRRAEEIEERIYVSRRPTPCTIS
jgi:hypothetical protein